MTTCAWCSNEAVDTVTIEPAKRKKDKRTGVMVEGKAAKTAPVCDNHRDIVDRQPPFYVCGCHYVKDEFKCLKHRSTLREPWKTQFSKAIIKHSKDAKKETKPFVVK